MSTRARAATLLPPGLSLLEAVLDEGGARAELDGLLAEIPWEEHHFRIFGRVVPMPRRIAWYGPHPYRYSGIEHPARPLPPRVEALRRVVEERVGLPFNSVLLNLYRDGRDAMGWHSDDDYEHGGQDVIASLSLGATRRFQVRWEGGRCALDLPSGSLLVMGPGFQAGHQHAVPRQPTVTGPRVNLTWRHFFPPIPAGGPPSGADRGQNGAEHP